MRRTSPATAIVGAVAVAITMPAPTMAAPVHQVRYSFDAGLENGSVVDDSGGGRTLRPLAGSGGSVAVVAGPWGNAIAFPSRCGAARCPRAILEGAHDVALNPATRDLTFGARVLLPADQTSAGSNIIQKGNADRRSQWKLQVDGAAGRPGCVVAGRGSSRIYSVQADVTVADGAWHGVTCQRTGGTLTIVVDGVPRGTAALPVSLTIDNTAPVRIGGKSVESRNDQFHGVLDELTVTVG